MTNDDLPKREAVHHFEMSTPLGPVPASWERMGRMIEVRYGWHKQAAQASENDATNEFVARNIVKGWIDAELKDDPA